MTPIDPRSLSDLDLLLYLAMGPEPRSKRRTIRDLVKVLAGVLAAGFGGWVLFVYLWATL